VIVREIVKDSYY